MRARKSSGSDVVSLWGSQTCWEGEMRPGYRLTTGHLQVSRPMLRLGLKTSFQIEEETLLRRECGCYSAGSRYRVTDDLSNLLWCSIPPRPSVTPQKQSWDASYWAVEWVKVRHWDFAGRKVHCLSSTKYDAQLTEKVTFKPSCDLYAKSPIAWIPVRITELL